MGEVTSGGFSPSLGKPVRVYTVGLLYVTSDECHTSLYTMYTCCCVYDTVYMIMCIQTIRDIRVHEYMKYTSMLFMHDNICISLIIMTLFRMYTDRDGHGSVGACHRGSRGIVYIPIIPVHIYLPSTFMYIYICIRIAV